MENTQEVSVTQGKKLFAALLFFAHRRRLIAQLFLFLFPGVLVEAQHAAHSGLRAHGKVGTRFTAALLFCSSRRTDHRTLPFPLSLSLNRSACGGTQWDTTGGEHKSLCLVVLLIAEHS